MMKNVLILTSWSYKDALIQTYTLPYIKIIRSHLPENSKIYLVTTEQKHLLLSKEELSTINKDFAAVNIELIPFSFQKALVQKGASSFFHFCYLWYLIGFKKISIIHTFCTPAGGLGYLLSLITGRPLVIDSYEPHAEAMVENGAWKRGGLKFRLLFYLEKKMSQRALCVISATKGMREYAKLKYNATFSKFYVKPACVDLNAFSDRDKKAPQLVKDFELDGKTVLVYAGKFGGIYLEKDAFDFFREAQLFYGDRLRILLLTAHSKEQIHSWCVQSHVDFSQMIICFVAHHEIPKYMGLGDFAFTPVKPVPTKRYCTPIKNGEYWALGLPIVITENISDDSEIIETEGAGALIEPGNLKSYRMALNKIEEMIKSSSKPELYSKIRILAEQYRNFQIAEEIYGKIYK